MYPVIAWSVAAAATIACLLFWFFDVRRIMRDQEKTVESAAGQLAFCRKRSEATRDPADAVVLKRSEAIYAQAVGQYNRTLHKLWICVPATLMGFHGLPTQSGKKAA